MIASQPSGTVTNTTGPLTVKPRTLVTVDDSGTIHCNPEPLPARGNNAVLKFDLLTSGYVFPDSGAIVVTSTRPATQCGATWIAAGDVSEFAQRNEVPRAQVVSDIAERAESVLRLEFTTQSGGPGVMKRCASRRTRGCHW